MRNIFLVLLFCCVYAEGQAQVKSKNRKYPSLLWEITGKGLKKPSYLFGTMHVSSKIAFHLSDSFYLGIKNADIVALETNPESWQENLTRYELDDPNYGYRSSWNFASFPNDYLSSQSLKLPEYEKQLEQALYSNPSTINNLLYRSYDYASDFEEDTYLDMYIYQVGKKWGKKVAGVERYDESMKLMMEAYQDAARDKNKKERSFDPDEGLSPEKLQEAYRTGNLDLLDSINKLSSFSDAFDEKFLYKRNDIQAASIDSILRNGHTLFVGVGAAHLPGSRGVIEILRRYGYKLRPIFMGERDSRHKDLVEKLRVPVRFSQYVSDDGFYKVDIPGRFYRFNDYYGMTNQEQYADMANGSYYIVTRVKTYSSLWGHSAEAVLRKIDSVLYENVPGKILSKQPITRNGFRGFDIVNRTRRGDYQRYNIFITPFEILFFKMSGTADYVRNGVEAGKFFGSIQLKDFSSTGWKKFEPASGGFSVDLPHTPFAGFDGNWYYEAQDKNNDANYTILRTDVHNYHFAGEDNFDLTLMEESFSNSAFIDTILSKSFSLHKGYPALDCEYRHANGSIVKVKYLIQGPRYYTLIAHARTQLPDLDRFLQSFTIEPFRYKNPEVKKDTSLFFTVTTPFFPEPKKEKITVPQGNNIGYRDGDDDPLPADPDDGVFRNRIISNDTTGEKIYVSFFRTHKYYFTEDSLELEKENEQTFLGEDSSWHIREKKLYELPGGMKAWEYKLGDSASSRLIRVKSFYRQGKGFLLMSQGDTISRETEFVKSFFDSFRPIDTLKGINPYLKKSGIYFEDFFSSDTLTRKRAIQNIGDITFEDTDLPRLKHAIASLGWTDKKYLEVKKAFINKLGAIKSEASSDYLKELFHAAGDTIELQYNTLTTLLRQSTQYAYNLFRDIVTLEPPVLGVATEADDYGYSIGTYVSPGKTRFNEEEGFLIRLFDSLRLTRTILPDLLPLLNLDDYQWPMMQLLGIMVDSGWIAPKDYEMYFSKFLIEAKQALKKQAITEKNKNIEKASQPDEQTYPDYGRNQQDAGNENLSLYATLLLPFSNRNQNVMPLIEQLLRSEDRRLKYNTMMLLIRHDKKIPDTLMSYFTSLDEFRYELYAELNGIGKLRLFPQQFNNHIELSKGLLFTLKTYDRPDTLAFLDRKLIEFRDRKGYVYFFKYREKRDDLNWQLATVGLVPEDESQFEFSEKEESSSRMSWARGYGLDEYDFTRFANTRIKEEEPLEKQLEQVLKKMLYSKRKSGAQFYIEERNFDYLQSSRR